MVNQLPSSFFESALETLESCLDVGLSLPVSCLIMHRVRKRLTTWVVLAGNHLTWPSLTRNFEKFYQYIQLVPLELRCRPVLTQSMASTGGSECDLRYFQIG